MKLHLIRHVHAVTEQEDPVRPLSLLGETDARRIAGWFRLNGVLQPAQLWPSQLAGPDARRAWFNAALLPSP